MDEQTELTPEETRALRDLESDSRPPADLEERTVARLRGRGLLAARRPVLRLWLLATAAGLALFAAGLFLGERGLGKPAPAASLPRYVLFLYDGKGETLTGAEEASRIAEYRDWAQALRRQGNDIRGEKLEPEGRWLGQSGEDPRHDALGGFFILSARDFDAAVEMARTCPHVKYGGRIEVRAVAHT